MGLLAWGIIVSLISLSGLASHALGAETVSFPVQHPEFYLVETPTPSIWIRGVVKTDEDIFHLQKFVQTGELRTGSGICGPEALIPCTFRILAIDRKLFAGMFWDPKNTERPPLGDVFEIGSIRPDQRIVFGPEFESSAAWYETRFNKNDIFIRPFVRSLPFARLKITWTRPAGL